MTSSTVRDSRTSEADELWLESYRGEVLGQAYFARMAELATVAEERRKIEHLVRLESSTREMLEPWLRRRGLPTAVDQEIVAAAGTVDSYDWKTLLEGVRPVAASYLAKYRRLAELADAEERQATDALIAHEAALDDFCRLELEGSAADSLAAIEALVHFR